MNSHRIRQQLLALTLPAGWFLSPAAVAQSTWNGTVNSDWADAANWSAGVPASAAGVTIADTTGGGNTLNLDSPRTIGSLTFGASGTRATNFTLNTQAANNLAINGGVVANGILNTTALTLRGHYTLGTDQNWSINGSAANNTDQGVFIREAAAGVTNRGSLVLGANLTKTGTGQLLFAAIDITGTGHLIVDSGGVKYNAGASQPLIIGGPGNITLNNASTLAIYKNSGTMNITRPIVLNGTSSLITRNSTVDVAAPLAFNGTHTLDAGGATNLSGAVSGGGTVNRIGAGALNLSGNLTGFSGILNTGAGTTNVQGAFGGTVNANAGTTTLAGPVGGGVSLAAGATLNGEVAVTGPLVLGGGTIGVDAASPQALGTAGNLTLTGTNTINLATNPVSTAPFPLLTYGGTLTGGVANLTLLGGTSSYRNPVLDDTASGVISLAVGSESRTWNGGAAWDINTSANWLEGDQKFFQVDAVTFGDTGAGPVALTGVLAPASITVDSSSDYQFTATAGNLIAGATGLVKAGTGVLTVGGVNTFTGGIFVNGGTLRPSANQAFGPSKTITVANGATLDANGSMNANRDYDLVVAGAGAGGGAVVNTGVNHQNGFRSLTLAADATLGGSGRWDFRPSIAGQALIDLDGHTLTKLGTNTIAFVDGVIAEPGAIDINEGIFAFTRSAISGTGIVTVNNGATLQLENYTSGGFTKPIVVNGSTLRNQGANFTLGSDVAITGDSIVTVNATFALTVSNPITGTGNLDKADAGNLILTADNTYGGTTRISDGVIQLGAGGSSGSITSSTIELASATAGLRFNRSDDVAVTHVISGSGITGNNLNPSAVTKDGANTLTLSAANTYTGTTRLAGGMIAIASDNSVFGDPSALIDLRNGGIRSADTSPRVIPNPLSFSNSTPLGSPGTGKLTFSGPIAFGGGTKSFIVNNDLTEVSGVINGGGAGTFLAKEGPGTLLFTGNNTYTQITTISSGVLQIGDGGTSGTLGSGPVVNNASLVIKRALPDGIAELVIGNAISGTGTLTHAGPAFTILGGANTYTGDTLVSDGTLSPSQPFFDDSSSIRLSGDGTLDLFHAQTDIVGRLFIDGVPQAVGLWGRVGSIAALGAAFETPLITGDGLLSVTASGTPFDEWAVDKNLTPGVNDDPADNPDFDRLDNLGEFALDGDPLSGLASGKVVVKVGSVGGSDALTLTLPVRAAVGAFGGADALSAAGDGVTYTIEGSDDLGTWLLDIDEVTGADAAALQAGLPALSNGDWVYRSFRSPGTVTGDPAEFMRVRIE
jgi:autotransporter-associated beta strand protein